MIDKAEWGWILAAVALIALAAFWKGLPGVALVVVGFSMSVVVTVRVMSWNERRRGERAEEAKREARRRASPL